LGVYLNHAWNKKNTQKKKRQASWGGRARGVEGKKRLVARKKGKSLKIGVGATSPEGATWSGKNINKATGKNLKISSHEGGKKRRLSRGEVAFGHVGYPSSGGGSKTKNGLY